MILHNYEVYNLLWLVTFITIWLLNYFAIVVLFINPCLTESFFFRMSEFFAIVSKAKLTRSWGGVISNLGANDSDDDQQESKIQDLLRSKLSHMMEDDDIAPTDKDIKIKMTQVKARLSYYELFRLYDTVQGNQSVISSL